MREHAKVLQKKERNMTNVEQTVNSTPAPEGYATSIADATVPAVLEYRALDPELERILAISTEGDEVEKFEQPEAEDAVTLN